MADVRRAIALSVAVLALAGCSREPASVLDRGPRVPDAEGVVSQVTPEQIRFEDGTAFRIDPEVESFTTRGHEVTALLSWQGKYVHVGVRDDRVVWVAGIGVVVRPAGREPSVLYTGVFTEMAEGRAVFEDGTTLALDEDVDPPEVGAEVVCTLDPATGMVTSIDA